MAYVLDKKEIGGKHMTTFNVIWPERRRVSEEQICSWYDDAMANGELDDGDYFEETVNQKAMALHRAGIVTLGHQTEAT